MPSWRDDALTGAAAEALVREADGDPWAFVGGTQPGSERAELSLRVAVGAARRDDDLRSSASRRPLERRARYRKSVRSIWARLRARDSMVLWSSELAARTRTTRSGPRSRAIAMPSAGSARSR